MLKVSEVSIALGLAAAMLLTPAFAQQGGKSDAPAATQAAPQVQRVSGQWRASKLIGVDVYNEQNEKLGDINELFVDRSGRITGVLIGVGGFLGMGQRDILVSMEKLKFVNEPLRSSARTDNNANARPGTTVGSGDRPDPGRRSDSNAWYPDHAILSGASKDSVKNMPEFKYD
jgi:sporulation protein YlmC with PRC-barrel domain